MSRSIDCIKLINDFLHPDKHKLREISSDNPRGFLIHETIIEQFKTRLECLDFPNFDQNTFDFKLHVGGKIFRMKLVWITVCTRSQETFLTEILDLANSSIFWERHAAIYISTQRFHRITFFLRNSHLSLSTIDHIVDQHKTSLDKTQITVVHFKSSASKSIEHEFEQFRATNYSPDEDTQYYVVSAFDFLKPYYLKYFHENSRSEPDTGLSTVFYLVLDYHRAQKRVRNIDVFNLIDLCAVKLALDDPRCENVSCEIIGLIEKALLEMQSTRKYIISDTFDLELYATDNGIKDVPQNILQYFVYRFNKYFSKLIYFDIANERFNPITIRLSDITFIDNLIKFIAERSSATVKIDGTNFKQMGGVLLARLIKSGVHELILDTSFEWVCNGNGEIRSQDLADHVTITFKNENRTNFVENCLNWMKSSINVSIVSWTIIFDGCQIHFPFVLNNLSVKEICISRMRMNSKIVHFLNRCQVKRIRLDCELDENSNVIASLENVRFLEGMYMHILEEPHTFQIIFKYVEEYLRAHNTYEYQFKRRLLIKNIVLDRFRFIWNTFENRIDIEDLETHTIIDLYLFKEFNQQFRADDKEEFDFYQ